MHVGLKGRLRLSWSWCFAHRLELACKAAFTSPNETLLTVVFLYEKSPAKPQELN